jgi:hypothetical protein
MIISHWLMLYLLSTRRFEKNRVVSQFVSTRRRIGGTKRTISSNKLAGHMVQGNIEMDSHADTIVCGANCAILHYTGKECDVSPYTDAYEAIKSVPIVQAGTAYDDNDTGETFILVFNQAIWMGDKMDNTLVNPNQLRSFGITVQDNPFDAAPTYVSAESDDFSFPLNCQGTILSAATRTPTDLELQTCTHVVLSSEHDWDPQHVHFPKSSRTVEEEIRRTIGSVKRKRDVDNYDYEDDDYDYDENSTSEIPVFNIAAIARKLVSSVKARAVPRRISQVEVEDLPQAKTFQSKGRHSTTTAEDLSERWHIGLVQAKETMKRTTQRLKRSAAMPLARRYRADRMFERKRLRGMWSSDTMDGRVTSIDGNRYGQVFANGSFFAAIYPMAKKASAGQALKEFISDFGVPDKMTIDGSKEQNKSGTDFVKECRKHDIQTTTTEPERSNQNPAEGVIREIRKKWFRIMIRKRVPVRLWDYGVRWTCEIMQRTSTEAGGLRGTCPLEEVTGETIDISEYLDFGFYDHVSYKGNAGLGMTEIGRWLGISHRVGSLMSYWILTKKGTVISRTTVQNITALEKQTDEFKQAIEEFDGEIRTRFKEDDDFGFEGAKPNPNDWSEYMAHDMDFQEEFNDIVNDPGIPEAEKDWDPDVYGDTYTGMELAIPRDGDGPEIARVLKRLKDADGVPIGRPHNNPIMDTRMYEVEYPDGHKAALAANAIAENMFAQTDMEGNRHVLFEEITDHRTDGSEVKQQDAFIKTRSGTERRRETTKGWEILVQWKDGSTTWVALKDMKESYPLQLAEYAVLNRIAEEPAFKWWVKHALKKRNRIIGKINSKYWVRTHKYGIKIPKNVKQAIAFDEENGNSQWKDAIAKEMKNVRPAFEVWEKDIRELPVGYQEIGCHLIFDVKLGENFRRKARFVAGGHTTETPAAMTYSSVVSRDSVRIALLIAALNDLDVLACDIQNAYLCADCRERIWTRAGIEFGDEEGTPMLVIKALYGLRSSGAAFRALLADTLVKLGYKSSYADPDVWMRPAVKKNGDEYYEYVLCYVDDVLCISAAARDTMLGIQRDFKLKDDKIAEPDVYLGATLDQMEVDGHMCWTMSPEKYVRAAVANVEENMAKSGRRLPGKCVTPFSCSYEPWMETSAELKADGVQYFQELIGVLRWAVEIGRVDILLEVSLLSTYLAMPREGHLEQALHIFGYLKTHYKRKLAFDPEHPNISEDRFRKCDWSEFYRDAEEAIPDNMPAPRGKSVTTHCFVDANHAGDKSTRRSQSGILLFANKAPIIWYSKRQNSVEASTFGSEFTAMKNAIELIESLRYKLRMFGIPVEGSTNVFCDNEAVCKNTTKPESVLSKKHHSISYHRGREAVAAGTIRVSKEGTLTNLSDLFTKTLPATKREQLLDRFTN